MEDNMGFRIEWKQPVGGEADEDVWGWYKAKLSNGRENDFVTRFAAVEEAKSLWPTGIEDDHIRVVEIPKWFEDHAISDKIGRVRRQLEELYAELADWSEGIANDRHFGNHWRLTIVETAVDGVAKSIREIRFAEELSREQEGKSIIL